MRHLDVERDDVGIERFDALPRDVGIGGRPDDDDFRISFEQARQQLPHDRGIVDDQDADWCLAIFHSAFPKELYFACRLLLRRRLP